MGVLIAWLWQGAAIACATAIVLACAPRVSAATRHAVWWLACASVLVLPFAYAVLSPATPAAAATVPVAAAPDVFLPSLFVAWCLFAAAALVRIGASIVAIVRLKATGHPPDAVLASRLARSRAAHLQSHVRVSDRIAGACALGLGTPVILLSRSLASRLDDEALAAVVLHEHAHLDRHDDWWQLLQALAGACAGWHPAVWFIGRQIAIEREAACDDRVLAREADAREYARALLHVAEFRHVWAGPERQLAIPGAAVSASALRRRVRRLLDARIDRRRGPAASTRLAASLAMAATVLFASRVPAIVAFEEVGALLPSVERAWLGRLHGVSAPRIDAIGQVGVAQPVAQLKLRATGARDMAEVGAGARGLELASGSAQLQLRELQGVAVPVLPAPLPSRVVHRSSEVAPAASASRRAMTENPMADSPQGPWTALGRSASSGGVTIGRFFTRAAKGIAGSF